MRILGIDPGLAIVGYSVLDIEKEDNILVSSGSIQTDKSKSDAERLLEIMIDMQTIIDKYKPNVASVEKLFYFKNQKTIIPVAEARGVILAILGLIGLLFSIVALFVSAGMINTKGSVRDGNRAIGTDNANLCSKCGRVLAKDDAFCKGCGEPASDKMKCKNCGAIISKEAQFCVKCGKTVK